MFSQIQIKLIIPIYDFIYNQFDSEKDFYYLKNIFVLRFYILGILFLIIPFTHDIALALNPFILLLVGIYSIYPLLKFEAKIDWKNIRLILLLILSTILIESLGVFTGIIFGNYSYGNSLGTKIIGVPLIIGLNWTIVVFGSTFISNQFFKNNYLIALIAGIFAVVFDLFLEPIAIKFDYWHWQNGTIPVQNYLAWFVITVIFSFIFQKLLNREKFERSGYTMIYQSLFFIILGLVFG